MYINKNLLNLAMKLKYPLLILILLILDQLTKYFFGFVQNTGAAFGILQGYNGVFIGISVIAFVGFGYYWWKDEQHRLASSLVIAGIVGNLIDRVALGYVRDFIDVRIWPVFNIADALMVVGVGLMVWGVIKKN